MKVLILVDIQNDFCPGGALAVPGGDEVVPIANALINSDAFELVIATKDWHPGGHISFADNHEGGRMFEVISLQGSRQTLWPRHCVQGSAGAELHPRLVRERIDCIVEKGTDNEVDSYSGFFDNNRRRETALRSLLEGEAARRGKVTGDVQLSVCGLALDYCVAATARDAIELGYATEVIVDGCRAVNLSPGDDMRILRELAQAGVEITTSAEIVPGRHAARSLEIRR